MSYLQDEGILTNLQSFRRCLKAFYAKKKTQNTSKITKERSCKQPAILSDLCTYQCKPCGGGVRARDGDLT